jgi:hypothetical protein
MNNVYPSEQHADIRAELKQQLLELKEEVGDTDDQYPELMKVRDAIWDQ